MQDLVPSFHHVGHRLSLKLPYILRNTFSYNWGVLLEMKSNFHFEIINDERRLRKEECDEVDNARKFLLERKKCLHMNSTDVCTHTNISDTIQLLEAVSSYKQE